MGDIKDAFQTFLECVLIACLGGGSPSLVLFEAFPLVEEGFHLLDRSPLVLGENPSPGPELLDLLYCPVGHFPDRFLEDLVAVEEVGKRLAAG